MGIYMKGRSKVEYERSHVKCVERGNYSIGTILRCLNVFLDFSVPKDSDLTESESGKKKVLFVVPGVTGSSSEEYIQDICAVANSRGYITVVLNCLANKDCEYD